MFVEYKCIVCGRIFPHEKEHRGIKTCSKECRYKNVARRIYKRVSRKCVRCGRVFDIPPAWLRKTGERGKYCSRECQKWKVAGFTDKEKWTAHNRVRIAIEQGLLERKPCEVCGNPKSQAHHYQGYAEENQLTVRWLCRVHHLQDHHGVHLVYGRTTTDD